LNFALCFCRLHHEISVYIIASNEQIFEHLYFSDNLFMVRQYSESNIVVEFTGLLQLQTDE
jgi:hypothetical protein